MYTIIIFCLLTIILFTCGYDTYADTLMALLIGGLVIESICYSLRKDDWYENSWRFTS